MKRKKSFIHYIIFISILIYVCVSNSYAQNVSQQIKSLQSKTYSSFGNGNIDEGLELSREGLSLAISVKDTGAIVDFLYLQSKLFRRSDHLDSAMNALVKGYLYAHQPAHKIKINHQIGEILLEIGSYQLSIPYLKEMVDSEKKLPAKFYHYNLLGQAYIQINDKANSVQTFENQLKVAKKLNDYHLEANAHNNLGFVLLRFNDLNSSKNHFEAVIKSLQKSQNTNENDRIILTNTHISLSKLYFLLNNYTKSIENFRIAQSLVQTEMNPISIYEYYLKSLLQTNQVAEAKRVLEKLQIQDLDDEGKLELSNLFITYYIHTNQNQLLQKEIQQHTKFEQKVNRIKAQKNQKNLDLIGQFYVTTAQNSLASEESKYQNLVYEKQLTTKLFWVSVIGGLILISLLVFYFVEKQKRAKIELQLIEKEKENLDISLQLKQKDLSKVSIDLNERAKILKEFLEQFKDAAKKDPHEVKQMVLDELVSLKQFDASRATLNQFLEHTDIVNTAFHEKLKMKHPDLSQNEIDLCSYILLNLSTKDIANLKNIEPNSVRINKTRLKKKLGLTEEDLANYLHSI